MGHLWSDCRFALRLLLRQPVLTGVAALSLGLGIGANTTIFSLVNEVFLRPLPLEQPQELVALFTTDSRNQAGLFAGSMPTSRLNYETYRDQNQVFTSLTAFGFVPLSVSGGSGEPEQVAGQIVSPEYFTTLRPPMALGRGFGAPENTAPGGAPATVLSYGFWQRRFGGASDILGRQVMVNGHALTVVGVTAESYTGIGVFGGAALWVPFAMYREMTSGFLLDNWDSRRALNFFVIGRLKPGTTAAAASANVASIGEQLARDFPTENRGRTGMLQPLADITVSPQPAQRRAATTAAALLMVIVGVVLLIACANVANLLLARAASRKHEIAVRISVGAGRGQLVRQLLIESLFLSVLGGAVGLAVAYWSRLGLQALRPPFLPPDALQLALDGRVLAFTALVALGTGVLFGIAPALQLSRPDLVGELKDRSSQGAGSGRMLSLRNLLVVAQVALSVVALVGAGLFLRSLGNARRIDPGFDAAHLSTLSFNLTARGLAGDAADLRQREILERVRGVPGVERAAVANAVPLSNGGFARSVFLEGQDTADARAGRFVQIAVVGDGYFEATGIPVLRGRGFAPTDRAGAPGVVVVNQTMADRFWPGEEAIGKRFKFFSATELTEVVGIAQNSKYNFLGEEPGPYMYQPLSQQPQPAVSLLVRSARPESSLGAVRALVQGMEPQVPLTNVSTMDTVLGQGLFLPRMGALLLTIFGGLALTLAAIGMYGVMAYVVGQRTREIGIRMALGASAGTVRQLVLRRGLALTGVGLAAGLALSAAAVRPLSALLFDVSAFDPVTFGAIPVLLLVVATAAILLPARRASRVNAIEALKAP